VTMGAAKLLYGWNAAAGEWLPMQVDATGKLKVSGAGVSSGATFPVAPTTGQLFLHTPTGRTILYEYDGANWQPIISYGTMTVCVDKTDGTDDLVHGTGFDAAAFKTIQYAWNAIPPLFGGDVTILINNENYTESPVFFGKKPTGNYVINFIGTLSLLASNTATSKVQGAAAVQGTLTKIGAFGAYDNLLVRIVVGNDFKVIDSDTADVLTIAGGFADGTNKAYEIYNWGTAITGDIQVNYGQLGVNFYNIKFIWATDWGIMMNNGSSAAFYRCAFIPAAAKMIVAVNYCMLTLHSCLMDNSCLVAIGMYLELNYSKAKGIGSMGLCVYGIQMTRLRIDHGTIIDGESVAGGIGVQLYGNCYLDINGAPEYCRVRNCAAYGIQSVKGSMGLGTAGVQYSGNGTNESAEAASFGYID